MESIDEQTRKRHAPQYSCQMGVLHRRIVI
uniref:Uncharacterized protein n=1 Tax=Rhizobium phage LG08 TaxID=3129229 RepID=A0AAU8HYA2_9CAUD